MADPLPWLRQGDVFESVPLFIAEMAGTDVVVREIDGAAVLITEDCQLDKRTNSGRPRPNQRLQFVPLRDIKGLGADREARLLARDVQPPEAVYVGEHEGVHLGGLLGELFSVPAAHFEARSQDFSSDPRADDADPFHLVVNNAAWPRLLTMDAEDRLLMHRKMWMFWTRTEPVVAP